MCQLHNVLVQIKMVESWTHTDLVTTIFIYNIMGLFNAEHQRTRAKPLAQTHVGRMQCRERKLNSMIAFGSLGKRSLGERQPQCLLRLFLQLFLAMDICWA